MTQTSPNQALFDIYMTKSRSPELIFDRQSLSPNTSFTKPRVKVFCTEGNLEQSVAYLNQELNVLGFPSLYDKAASANGFSVLRLVNNLYELLQLQVRNSQVKDDLEARQQRSDCDNDFLTQCQVRLKSELDSCQREIAQLTAKHTELLKTKMRLESTIKTQKEEIKKMKGNVQHLKKQFEHEIRKKETEMTKMKEKIIQLLNDKTKGKCLGMDILNSIQRTDGKRGTWNKGNKHEEDMYRLLINNYDERQKEIIEENNDLRELLKHTEDQLVNLLNKENQDIETDSRDEGGSDDDCVSVSSLTGGHYQMPLELVREGIEKSIREKWAMLKEKMENSKKDKSKEIVNADDNNDKIIKLRSELDKYKYIVIQQEEHIQRLQDAQTNTGKVSILDDSLLVEEKDKIEEEKILFKNEKRAFDEDRKRFTEAAIKLGHERERFNEEKALFLKQQLLNSSPSPKSSVKGRKKSDNDDYRSPRLHTQTPVFVSAPRPKDNRDITTPSTEDLYNVLSLRTNRECDETPRRTWSHDGPRRLSKTSSQTSGNTDEQIDEVNENEFSARKSKRIGQHAFNIKKALLKQHNNLDTSTHSYKLP